MTKVEAQPKKRMTKYEIANSFFAGEGGRGIRVIPFQTETDSQGTEENVEVMSNRELLASAWQETRKYFRFDDATGKWVPKKSWATGLGETKAQIVIEEAMKLEDESLLKGCLSDFVAGVGEPIHPNWVDWSQGELPPTPEDEDLIEPVSDRRDEVSAEPNEYAGNRQFPGTARKVKIEIVNWLHIKRMEYMRDQIVKALERVIDRQHKTRDIRGLRETLRVIHQKRDESFCLKTLEMVMKVKPSLPLRDKRNTLLFMEKSKKIKGFDPMKHLSNTERRVYYMYTESRKLTFEQHKYLKGYTETLISLLESVIRGTTPKVTFQPNEKKRDPILVRVPTDEEIERVYIIQEYSDMMGDLIYYRQFYKQALAAKDREWVLWAIEKGMALKTRLEAFEKEHKLTPKDLDPPADA